MYLESLREVYQQAGFYQREKKIVEIPTEKNVETMSLDELKSKLSSCEKVRLFLHNNINNLVFLFFNYY